MCYVLPVIDIHTCRASGRSNEGTPRGSIHTISRELGPKLPYYRRNYGCQFPNGCICGPSGTSSELSMILESQAAHETSSTVLCARYSASQEWLTL